MTVTTGTGGRIVELLVNEGDSVEAGRVVMRLDAASLVAQIIQAEAGGGRSAARAGQPRPGPEARHACRCRI